MTIAAVAVAVSLALPYFDFPFQPNLFGSDGGSSVFGVVTLEWPLGVPLGYVIVALALVGVVLGALSIAKRGGRVVGAIAVVVWIGLGGIAAGWWQSFSAGEVGPGAGAVLAATAVALGVLGAIVVAASPSGERSRAW